MSRVTRISGGLTVALCAACSTTSPTASGAPTATGIGVESGSAQQVALGGALTAPLVVHVTDQYGDPMPNVGVTFTASAGINVAATSATTDTNGNAQTTANLTGTVAGIDTVTASVSGVTVPARFLETALAGAPVGDSIVSGNQQTGPAGTALPLPLAVQVRDQYGNLVTGDTVTWTSPTGTLSSPTSVTDATGTAQVTFTPASGSNTVTAAIGQSALTALFSETGE